MVQKSTRVQTDGKNGALVLVSSEWKWEKVIKKLQEKTKQWADECIKAICKTV